jgi:hypothetical protein
MLYSPSVLRQLFAVDMTWQAGRLPYSPSVLRRSPRGHQHDPRTEFGDDLDEVRLRGHDFADGLVDLQGLIKSQVVANMLLPR